MDTEASSPSSGSAPATPQPDRRWAPSAADFAQMRRAPVVCQLDDLAVLQLEGPDSGTFLQSQTTADIGAMSPKRWQLGGYCTAKGRLLAIFEAWRWQSGLRMLLPADNAQPNLRQLSKFVLRAKVRLADVTASWAVLGICGPGTTEALASAGVPVPDQPWGCEQIESDGRIARLPTGRNCPERVLLVVSAADAGVWRQRLGAVASAGNGIWWWTQIDAAIPQVFAATRELFVPQAVNLEVLGGVSFRKGCYPGQEVVARSQYLGKLRRRLGLAHAPEIGPAPDIFHSNEAGPVGRIVMAAMGPDGGWDLLFECPSQLTEHGTLHAGGREAPAMLLRELPYRIFDPTA